MQKILVIKLSALGDFILAMGAMEAIRKHHAGAHITLLTTRPFVDMAERSGYFDEIWIDSRPSPLDWDEWAYLFRGFNKAGFDRVYDLQLNQRTSVYYRLFLKKPEWSGIVRSASHFYRNPDWRKMHAFDRHRTMLAEFGIEVKKPDLSWMKVDISPFGLKKPYVLLVPGSAPQHPEKRWSDKRYAALALKFILQGYSVAVIGTAAEGAVIDRIVKVAPAVVNLAGRTSLYDIAALAMDAAGAVGNDTGPTHLIALAGCPAVALFSAASNPAQSAPVGNVAVIQADDLDDVSVDTVMKAFQGRAAA